MWPTDQKLHAAGEQHVASAEEFFDAHLESRLPLGNESPSPPQSRTF